MQCRANEDGLIGTHYVRAGEVFDCDGPAPRWATPLDEPAAPVKATKKKAAPKGDKE